MNMKKNAAMLFLALLVAGTAFAFQGNPAELGPNCDEEAHELMEQALNAREYENYLEIREEYGLPTRGIFRILTNENFPQFTEMREAMIAGDLEKAAEIRGELGLPENPRKMQEAEQGMRKGAGQKMHKGNGMKDGSRNGTGMQKGNRQGTFE